jgi:hypothetical protein
MFPKFRILFTPKKLRRITYKINPQFLVIIQWKVLFLQILGFFLCQKNFAELRGKFISIFW